MHASRATATWRARWKTSRAQDIAAAAATSFDEGRAGAGKVFEAADDGSEPQPHFQAVQGAPVATSQPLDTCCALPDAVSQSVRLKSDFASALDLTLLADYPAVSLQYMVTVVPVPVPSDRRVGEARASERLTADAAIASTHLI